MKKIKITKEQFDILVKNGLITESINSTKEDKPKKEASPDNITNEIKELLKHLYGYTPEFNAEFWVDEKGKTIDEICDYLIAKGVLVKKGRNFIVPKSLGSNEEAKAAVETAIREFIGEPEVEIEEDYPAGAEHDSSAPYNQPDQESIENHTDYVTFVYNDGLAILRDKYTNQFFLLDFHDNNVTYEGREMTEDDINEFLNTNDGKLEKILIPLDENLLNELSEMYDLNKFFISKLQEIKALMVGNIKEGNSEFADHYSELQPKKRTNGENSKILDKLKSLKNQSNTSHPKPVTQHPLDPHPDDVTEVTGAASSGSFSAPMTSGPIKSGIQTVYESTIASTGNFQYDTPGLVGISRDGKFQTNTKKPKAFKTPQWAGGSMVDQPECSKLNNNKEAQNGGCNSGAESLKTKESKGSVNAPTLGENQIFEEIANQTGKTIEEVKQIISNKNYTKEL